MAGTVLRQGWSDPQTGVFGAHPRLGGPLDLNDGVTFTLLEGGLTLEPPPRELALAGNPRTQGERGLRARYRHNRRVTAQLLLGPMASASDLAAELRALAAWLNAAPAQPVALQWQAPNAANPVYLDIVGGALLADLDEIDWLRAQGESVTIVLSARPGLRGDRVMLQNLAMNPGFEAPSGPGVTVFNDPLANANAYATLAGSAPTLASNLLTIPAGATVGFGSPAWSAVNTWQVRFKWVTGLTASFDLHSTNATNKLQAVATGTALTLNQVVGGTVHQLGTLAAALTNGNFYWLQVTQFPTAPGNPPLIQATLLADAGGAVGASVATVGPYATWDAVTALAGQMAIEAAGAALAIGGAFNNVHTVSLFGPGGWLMNANAALAIPALAWEQNSANTYPGGPVTSFGCARIDLPPAGTVDCDWRSYNGGIPLTAMANGLGIIPIAANGAGGDTLQASVWARTNGLSANATLFLQVKQYDGSGAQLATTTLQSVTGNHAAWTQLAGSVVTQAGAVYASVIVRVSDTSAPGASANGTVWFDNAQCWDATATGQASMPYCELRFPQAPAQMLVSGLLGDLPAPAAALLGTYLASWPLGASLTWALARRDAASTAAALVGDSLGYQPTGNASGVTPTVAAALDSASHGGYYLTTTLTAGGFNPRAFSFAPGAALGVYHLFGRFWSAQTVANLPNAQTRVVTQQRNLPWFGSSDLSDQTGQYNGPVVAPLAAASTWTLADSGQVSVPALPAGALTSLSQGYLTPRAQWSDSSSASAAFRTGWQALLPVDGALALGAATNPTNGPYVMTTSWLWLYLDGLLTNRATATDAPAATLSIEARALANPARGASGPGSDASGSISVNSGADPYLTLDPTAICPPDANGLGVGGAGVNQLVALMADGAGAVLPIACDLVYTPLYLYPR